LRDGEGSAPDVSHLIGLAVDIRRRRRERRNRVIGAVAAVLVVGGVGVGIASTRGGKAGESAARGNTRPEYSVAVHAPRFDAESNASGNAGGHPATLDPAGTSGGATACPAKPIQYALPGGGGAAQFGANGPLVDKPVSSLTFCVYDPVSSAQTLQGSRVLEGSKAQQWIDMANHSSVTRYAGYCLAARNIEILVFDSAGAALTPLRVLGECMDAQVTNGTAVRYVPLPQLDAVTAGSQPTSGMSGSPPR